MIDDDDKLRRNVVIFSAAVLAVTFLDLPIGSISAKLLGAENAQVSVFRVWLLALFTLFYLVIRFSFPETPTNISPVDDWKSDYSKRCSARREALITKFHAKRIYDLEKEVVQTYLPADEYPLDTPPRLGPRRCPGKTYFPPTHDLRLDKGKFWSGTLLYTFTETNESGQVLARLEIRDAFKVPARTFMPIALRAAALATIYSNTAANWLFPRALAVLATLCISVKLVHAW